MTETPSQPYVDPLDEAPDVTDRGALALTVVAYALAAFAVVPTGWSFLAGPIGMACGLIANLKGRRSGFVAACLAALATVIGLSLQFLFAPN